MTALQILVQNGADCEEKLAIRDSLLAPIRINCFARIRKIKFVEPFTYGKNGFAKIQRYAE